MASSRAGRAFDTRNAEPPACVQALAEKVPACFPDARIWRLYLDEAYRGALDDYLDRRRIERGESPDFCRECTQEYRARMQGEGRCHPPVLTEPKVGRPRKERAEALTEGAA